MVSKVCLTDHGFDSIEMGFPLVLEIMLEFDIKFRKSINYIVLINQLKSINQKLENQLYAFHVLL